MNRKKFFGQVDTPPHIAVSLIDFANLKFNTFLTWVQAWEIFLAHCMVAILV